MRQRAQTTRGFRDLLILIVEQIRRADYEADREALTRLCNELAPFANADGFSSRALYWCGFAMWRKAINGFNDSATAEELNDSLNKAIGEFDMAFAMDETFMDAKIAAGSARGWLAYLYLQQKENPDLMQELAGRARSMLNEAGQDAPNNPRLLWVLGPLRWNAPPERGGGPEKAMELYERGLETIRGMNGNSDDPLEPSWGEPELRMSLAWSYLNQTPPNLDAAEREARAALAAVYDFYARRIHRYFYSRVENAEDAEDLTAQTFMSVIEALPRYQHRGYFTTWVFQIAHSKVMDFFRRNHSKVQKEASVNNDVFDEMLEKVIQDQRVETLRLVIQLLDDDERELLRLRFVAELSYNEIAELLGRKEDAVRKSVNRILERLYVQMEAKHA